MESARRILQMVQSLGEDCARDLGKKTSRATLINKLNYINFLDGTVIVNIRNPKFNRTISLDAKPLPCLGERLDCLWDDPSGIENKLKNYVFQDLIVTDGQKIFLVEPEVIQFDDKGISLQLPDTCCELSTRRSRRHSCQGISVQFIQNSAVFHGALVDFSCNSFRVKVTAVPPQTFQWVNAEQPVTLILNEDETILYSGECRILRQSYDQRTRTFALEPTQLEGFSRFKPKEFRSSRQKLVPAPNAILTHPFTKRTVDLKVIDLSGSGFSVEEYGENPVLVLGLIIPEVSICFTNSFTIKCKAQVVYRNSFTAGNGDPYFKCGLAIVDMDIENHVLLLSMLQQANDQNTYVCKQVDMDSLWNFFFETGFIYPEKYTFLQKRKDQLKELYEKLYTKNPNIARHFIYQERGQILGHMAMLRFYDNSWMIHHHASDRGETNHGGLMVLSQISRYVNDIHNLFSAHLNFVFCFFRPNNKFPRRVFGGVAKHIMDQKGCSLDTFAYFHYHRDFTQEWDNTGPWSLSKVQDDDLVELEFFYEKESGGLMINAFDLEPGLTENPDLKKEYGKMGFKRERHLFSLKKDGVLKAIFIVDEAEIGINLSDLTNSIKVIVVDPDDLPKSTLQLILSLLLVKFGAQELPVLLYPLSYAQSQTIAYEKLYTLWILNLQFLDQYFKFCETLLHKI